MGSRSAFDQIAGIGELFVEALTEGKVPDRVVAGVVEHIREVKGGPKGPTCRKCGAPLEVLSETETGAVMGCKPCTAPAEESK